MKIEIISVQSKKDLKSFILFPKKIYSGDPHWVPHLWEDRVKILDKKKNPFFQHADAEYFLALRNNQIVGRIAAIENKLHNETHHDKVGFFGFFECINDKEVATELFKKAAEWLKVRGFDEVRGPANPSSNDEYGLLIEGFGDSPRLLMTYNPEYYMELIESFGFKKAKDLYAFKIDADKMMATEKLVRGCEIAQKRSGLVIKGLDMKNFDTELEKVKKVYNQAWAPNYGFIPMTDAEIEFMAADLKMLIDPELVVFGEINGEVVGFALVLPDYNVIFKEMKGNLYPFGFLKLFTKKKLLKWARVITLGIIPGYQKRGLDAVFYMDIMRRAAKRGIYHGEASWILEDNDMMVKGAALMGGELYKKYRIYSKSLI